MISDHEIREQLKKEADEVLFEGIHFDSRLKENVKRRAQLIQEPPLQGRAARNPRRWLLGTAAAAVIAFFLIIAAPSLFPSWAPPPAVPGETFHRPLPGNIEPGDELPPSGDSGEEIRVLTTFEEAGALFGEKLLVPSYIPAGFSLHEINAGGPEGGLEGTVVYSYVAGSRSFGLFQHKQEESDVPKGKAVDINGGTGYLTTGDPGQEAGENDRNIELHWHANGVEYMLSGILPVDEALKIARSMERLSTQ
ncbi:DUF4367 domain-containing protein [Paenibacillus sp. sptzw28]|uniref:DUF4367 domain-containing protein n=1 Tax=Paenibacillus sp. sptzw28 TaxID=715179 RepID=UPI001C6E0465|nr:DUF4367 domain-containing protein [Paenibacillus sp. sptzw28]QYR22806.1 DUF4367 domain-containing protein [Paenibacillus sp. sptzw28]